MKTAKWTVMMKLKIRLGNDNNCSEFDKAANGNDLSTIEHNLEDLTIALMCLLFILRISDEGKNKREGHKGIVFLSQLLFLFQHCHKCFSSKLYVSVPRSGIMLTLESKCNRCKDTMTWNNQPYRLGKFPAGNILLSFGILAPGASTLRFFESLSTWGC